MPVVTRLFSDYFISSQNEKISLNSTFTTILPKTGYTDLKLNLYQDNIEDKKATLILGSSSSTTIRLEATGAALCDKEYSKSTIAQPHKYLVYLTKHGLAVEISDIVVAAFRFNQQCETINKLGQVDTFVVRDGSVSEVGYFKDFRKSF